MDRFSDRGSTPLISTKQKRPRKRPQTTDKGFGKAEPFVSGLTAGTHARRFLSGENARMLASFLHNLYKPPCKNVHFMVQ